MMLDQYRKPIAMNDPGQHAARLAVLPHEPDALARTVQGLMIHQHIASTYGVTLSPDQRAQSHVRGVETMLDAITMRDARPLSTARAAGERQVGVCRHFTLLHVAMLRTHGIPARARCGFGAYFEKGRYIDHWVHRILERTAPCLGCCSTRRSTIISANCSRSGSIRQTCRATSSWLPAMPWQLCRSSKADPGAFGILDMHGLWFIAGNLIRRCRRR